MDINATADAILLLDKVRRDAAPLPMAVWQILSHASDHLSGQLRAYLIPAEKESI